MLWPSSSNFSLTHINGGCCSSSSFNSTYPHSIPIALGTRWPGRKSPFARGSTHRTSLRSHRLLPYSNVCNASAVELFTFAIKFKLSKVYSAKEESNADVTMVDPLEAKRLAAKQMAEIRAKELLKRRRKIEAINGAWAMIGLTTGLVFEGQTGKSVLNQLAGYLEAITHLFPQ